jgi:predicted ATPase/DNA-binding SARP family transcriptional activator
MTSASARLRIYLFGQYRIERGTEQIRLPTRKIEALLAYLILRPHPHSREHLASLLWGDFSDGQARASLRNALASLRRNLGGEFLLSDREMVQINSAYPVWVDALDFQFQAAQLLKTPTARPQEVELDLYTGDLLVGCYDDWAFEERERFRTMYLDTVLAIAQRMRSESHYQEAIRYAWRVLTTDPANEQAHQHLMFCYLALGDRKTALRQYEACRRALMEELAVDPSPGTQALYEKIQQESLEGTPHEAALTNLPIPLTSFVGRQRELTEIRDLLIDVRSLTLTGAGGSGKSRLAIQTGAKHVEDFEDGVWWVELASLEDDNLVPRRVAQALGIPEVPNQPVSVTLTNFLRSKRLLLVMDNCEHLSSACARLIHTLLNTCPHLKILTTSREALGFTGERTWYVPPLAVPDPGHAMRHEQLVQYEAISLFIERAAAVSPGFNLTEHNTAFVEQICRQLDGLPLAIELAASRVKVLGVEQIAGRLQEALLLLAGGSRTAIPRHQTLRATMDWSHDLLTEQEHALFRRLAVFAGGWTLEAAEAVCTGDGIKQEEVVDLLTCLVDKSLVETHTRGNEVRFGMLQTVQKYSQEKLHESGEHGTLRSRHLDFYLRLADAANPHLGFFLSDREMVTWLDKLDPELDNLRLALNWCLENQAATEAGLRLAGRLHWYWFGRGHLTEGRRWLAQLDENSIDVPKDVRGQASLTAGYLACWQGDFSAGKGALEQSFSLFGELEDDRWVAFSLHGLGWTAIGEGNPILGRSHLEKCLHIARELEDDWLTSFALHFLGIVLSYQGDHSAAIAAFEECITIFKLCGGNLQGEGFSLFHLARIARLQGDYETARTRCTAGLQLFHQIGDRRGIGYCLAGLAVLACEEGEYPRAGRLSGAVAAVQAVLGMLLEVPLQLEYDHELAKARDMLGEEAFARVWDEGMGMMMPQAIEYALTTVGE